ncbi:ESPR domain-containing protein, partial [Rhodanobacter sp. Root179]|uniref:ESPR domain-containing protein n=1 Tax=Rhodanobacter sp. Root179 TaxID=1736482 RepID=UPI000A6B7BA1
MNKIYRKVWSRTLGAMVAVSELASTRGKAGSVGLVCGAVALVGALALAPVATASAQNLPATCQLDVGTPGAVSGDDAFVCGPDASATGDRATAVGALSFAGSDDSAAFGAGALALGIGSSATGSSSVAIGQESSAYG